MMGILATSLETYAKVGKLKFEFFTYSLEVTNKQTIKKSDIWNGVSLT